MEDSVGEEERREQEEAMAQGKERGEEEQELEQDAGAGRVEEEQVAEEGGFLSSMASKIGAAMSGTNGSGSPEPGDVGEANGNGIAVAASDGEGGEEEKEDCNGGGGIFHRLLSSSPASSPSASAETEEEKRGGKDEDEGGEQAAGILSTVASKIGLAMSGANGSGGSEEDAKQASNGDVGHSEGEVKNEGDESTGGAGIVKQIIANLPNSDTRGPNAEEASMLIAIIDD
ncbi:glycine-rich protein 1 isoform X2 [Brachypodium distachyon]|uniref:Uncharacterized protein n=1 Tax=Brachypodium distachyon TaxID=15368 RepID=A0A0Q3HGU2_BRADI|nr:glycine-rich protein 1 isoform X2 [Brachypodium distachyon]KQK22103.1 hypothetical protein BRADI_1g65230v3 [Brachypodium distachyon]|eukprot:XP_010228732.1 glycine-rich protein 1 isoform X2 [Brachypodium distachyon]